MGPSHIKDGFTQGSTLSRKPYSRLPRELAMRRDLSEHIDAGKMENMEQTTYRRRIYDSDYDRAIQGMIVVAAIL